jgi:hypothetical protein
MLGRPAFTAPIYVDSRIGDDRLDGAASQFVSAATGPVRTLQRGIRLLKRGDSLVLVNNGVPYTGGIALHGLQMSGTSDFPVEIIGNGAAITGVRPVPQEAWVNVQDDVWRITPFRKGWQQLVLDGAALPEVACPREAPALPDLPPNSWCIWQGAIHYRPAAGLIPQQLDLFFADEQTGITLVGVENVVIRDLVVQHFRQDGIHLHDRCGNVLIENVTCRENGRAGLVVGGTSQATLVQPKLIGNREFSLLVEELGGVDVDGGEIVPAPVVRD